MTSEKHLSILFFDSGAGGLTIAKKVLNDIRLSSIELHYLADKAFYPYGAQTQKTVLHRTIKLVSDYLNRHPIDIIVIACNTASTIVLPKLRSLFNQPIIGVVPAIKPAAQITQSQVIGVLATSATVERMYTHDLIKEFAQNKKVIMHGSQALVEYAEQHLENLSKQAIEHLSLQTSLQKLINSELEQLFSQPNGHRIDTLVLACTHFPILLPYFQQVKCNSINPTQKIEWIDSGEAITHRIAHFAQKLLGKKLCHNKDGQFYHGAEKLARSITIEVLTQRGIPSADYKKIYCNYLKI